MHYSNIHTTQLFICFRVRNMSRCYENTDEQYFYNDYQEYDDDNGQSNDFNYNDQYNNDIDYPNDYNENDHNKNSHLVVCMFI